MAMYTKPFQDLYVKHRAVVDSLLVSSRTVGLHYALPDFLLDAI